MYMYVHCVHVHVHVVFYPASPPSAQRTVSLHMTSDPLERKAEEEPGILSACMAATCIYMYIHVCQGCTCTVHVHLWTRGAHTCSDIHFVSLSWIYSLYMYTTFPKFLGVVLVLPFEQTLVISWSYHTVSERHWHIAGKNRDAVELPTHIHVHVHVHVYMHTPNMYMYTFIHVCTCTCTCAPL